MHSQMLHCIISIGGSVGVASKSFDLFSEDGLKEP